MSSKRQTAQRHIEETARMPVAAGYDQPDGSSKGRTRTVTRLEHGILISRSNRDAEPN